MRIRFLLCLLLAACGGGGGDTTLDPCGPNGECPAGFVCNPADNLCYAEGTIRFDAGLPSVLETEIVTKPPARTRELRAELTFTGGPSFRCQLDGQVIDPCTSPFVGDVSEGAHRFEVAAIDGKGTSDPTPASHSWEVDRTGPAVALTGPSEGSTTGPNVSFMFTSEAGATFRCSFDADSRNQPPCPGSQASATLAAGGHRFSVTAFDDLGNAGEPAARGFTVDDTGPAVTVIPLPGNLSQSVGTLTYVSDPEVAFDCKLDGDGFEPCLAAGFPYSGLSPGAHTFVVHATDRFGNTGGETSYTFTVFGTATIRVDYRGTLVPDAVVVSHRADGTVIAETRTNAQGVATARVIPSGMVTAAFEPTSLGAARAAGGGANGVGQSRLLFTMTGVEPGDILRLGEPDRSFRPGAHVQVTGPGTLFGATTYNLTFGADNLRFYSGIGGGFDFFAGAYTDEGKVNLLAQAKDAAGGPRGFSFVAGLTIPPGTAGNVTLPDWSLLATTLQVRARNIPTGTDDLRVDLGLQAQGVSYRLDQLLRRTPPAAAENLDFLIPANRLFEDRLWIRSRFFAGNAVRQVVAAPPVNPDGTKLLPSITALVIDNAMPARPRMGFTLAADATIDGALARFTWFDGTFSITWDVASPPGTSVQVPSLPASLASFAPRAGDKISGEIRLIDSTATPRYADFRLLYFFLRDFGIGSHTSTNDPPIPGRLPFTTRETYRFVDAQ